MDTDQLFLCMSIPMNNFASTAFCKGIFLLLIVIKFGAKICFYIDALMPVLAIAKNRHKAQPLASIEARKESIIAENQYR